jgi:hypothetical protein
MATILTLLLGQIAEAEYLNGAVRRPSKQRSEVGEIPQGLPPREDTPRKLRPPHQELTITIGVLRGIAVASKTMTRQMKDGEEYQ